MISFISNTKAGCQSYTVRRQDGVYFGGGCSAWKGAQGGFCGIGKVLFLDFGVGDMAVFSLQKIH